MVCFINEVQRKNNMTKIFLIQIKYHYIEKYKNLQEPSFLFWVKTQVKWTYTYRCLHKELNLLRAVAMKYRDVLLFLEILGVSMLRQCITLSNALNLVTDCPVSTQTFTYPLFLTLTLGLWCIISVFHFLICKVDKRIIPTSYVIKMV